MLRETGIGGVTTRGAVFERVPEVPVMVTVPAFKVVASPVWFTVAMVLSEVDQVGVLSAREEPSE